MARSINENRAHRVEIGAWPAETPGIHPSTTVVDAEFQHSTRQLGGIAAEIGCIAAVIARTPVRIASNDAEIAHERAMIHKASGKIPLHERGTVTIDAGIASSSDTGGRGRAEITRVTGGIPRMTAGIGRVAAEITRRVAEILRGRAEILQTPAFMH